MEADAGTDGDGLRRRRKQKRSKDKKTAEEEEETEPTLEQHQNGSDTKKKKKRRSKESVDDGDERKEQHSDKGEDLPTVSIAVSGSIVDNAQSLELATILAGQIARAAAIFRIDEVVVFDNKAISNCDSVDSVTEEDADNESGARFLVRILQYLETPQYLRRRLFPMSSSLRFVGLLPPLDAPHHVRKHEWSPFREGVTLETNPSRFSGTSVDVGLSKNVVVEQVLEPGLRITVAMGTNRNIETDCFKRVVKASTPREEMGLYWGYKVRYSPNISSVFKNCPYKEGYDHIIGTSEHGRIVKSSELIIPKFRHLLIAFGGLGGLEESIEEDINLKGKDVHNVFISYLNTCPLQGSRTIRTEEAIFISLQYFQEPIKRAENSS